jgi:glycosyltransferase involved in cell wall biosynthesis
MKINFLVPTLGITGGIKVIFEYANNLSILGHKVVIIHPYVLEKEASLKNVIKGKLKRLRQMMISLFGINNIKWFVLLPEVSIKNVPNLSEKYIPSSDVTIATANETADWLVDYSKDKGKKFYFIQDYEVWTRSVAKVDATWKMPLEKIVIAKWLERLAEEKFGEKVRGIVPNGLNIKEFYNAEKVINKEKRVLIMYHALEKKGFFDGLKAFETAKEKHPELKLIIFGAYKPKEKKIKKYPFFYRVDQNTLRKLFSTCDIFIWPSRIEGFGLPPMQAMACKCAVISTDTGAIRDYAVHGESAIIVPPKDHGMMAKYISDLVEEDGELKRISDNAYEQIKKFNIEKSTLLFEKILLNN